jgi:hypothetical protein
MKFIDNPKDMPLFQEKDKNGRIEHIYCDGSRKHVLSYGLKGDKAFVQCSEPDCEVNFERKTQ